MHACDLLIAAASALNATRNFSFAGHVKVYGIVCAQAVSVVEFAMFPAQQWV